MIRISSVLAHGVDVVKITRFQAMLARHGGVLSQFARRLGCRILNGQHEMPRFCQLVALDDGAKMARYLAGCWAVKEAVYKTLDPEDQQVFEFKNWYKSYDGRGKPAVAADDYCRKQEEFAVSLSHDEEVLVASVIRLMVHTLSVK